MTVRVSDGTEVDEQTFNLTVIPDLDNDGIADANDDDVDGDGIPNSWEIEQGFDPRNAADGADDSEGDGWTNLEEYQNGGSPQADNVAPVLTVPGTLTVNAKALFTTVDFGQVMASDAFDGELTPVADKPGPYAPGTHVITWSATDQAGNRATATQTLRVRPLVQFSRDQRIGEAGFPEVTIGVHLNGTAPTYPVTVPYTVGGTATVAEDHTLISGVVTINSGTQGSITFDVVDDGPGDDLETIVVTMGTPTNAAVGVRSTHTITLSEVNEKPMVTLSAKQQSSATTSMLVQGNGLAVISARIQDPNLGDTHTLDWSDSDSDLVNLDDSGSTFTIDPAATAPGVYRISVAVTDSGNPPEVTTASVRVRVVKAAPVLSNSVDSDGDGIDDATEGYVDSDNDGVPDYLDGIAEANVLEEQSGRSTGYLMETNPGLSIRLGEIALVASEGGSRVTRGNIRDYRNAETDRVRNVGGYFDFEVQGLPEAGQTAQVVVSLFEAIPEKPVYRKHTPEGWQDFVENGTDSLASASGEEGYCPPPGDDSYTPGLTTGDWCVQLTIQDGGPNDDDGLENNAIVDPGGVGTLSSGGSGGGSLSIFGLLFLAGLSLLRRAAGRSR